MKKALPWIFAVLLIAGAAFGILKYLRSHRDPGPRYATVTIDRGRIAARVTATGVLSALVTVQVGSQVSGRIESIRADFNSPVKKGQIVATIEPTLFEAAVEQARANDASARANVDKSKAQEMDAERQYTRAKQLGEQKLIAQADVDTAEANYNIAKATVAAAVAGVQQSAASLHQAIANLKYATIYSPIDGVVISRSVDVGQTVAASLQAPTLFTIAQDLTKMQVDTSVAEGDVGKIQSGMHVWFTVDAYPGQRFDGTVRQVRDAAVTVQNVVTYDAVIDVDNEKRLLKPGMTATVTFTPAERNDVLRIPNAALRYRPTFKPPTARAAASAKPRTPGPQQQQQQSKDQRTVYRLVGRRAQPVDIQIGLSDGSLTEIVSGDLKEGDAVITESLTEPATTAPASVPTRLPRGF
ncbi:MAG TPA: efflux RND transporter periplasmic adaptor subunit [Polyangiaceae bacterium]|nr:efflux RND transporter periplasmic adaptor subunit [Polyangiaceae bacterium]